MPRKKPVSDPRTRGRQQQSDVGALAGEQEVYEETVEDGGITLRTKKRAGRLMWVSLFFLMISILLIFAYITFYNSSIVNAERSCWLNEQNVEQLAQRYVTENGFSSLPAYVEDIPGFANVVNECPSGGSYTWNPITGQYSCSEHQHWPDGFNQAESINQGTTTVMVEVE